MEERKEMKSTGFGMSSAVNIYQAPVQSVSSSGASKDAKVPVGNQLQQPAPPIIEYHGPVAVQVPIMAQPQRYISHVVEHQKSVSYPASSLPRPKERPYFGIDVECVATGAQHNDRAVAHIAIVDQWCRLILNVYVQPKEKVFSYLSALTGLSEELLSKGVSLDTAIAMIKKVLPSESILVGQNVLKDVEWLGLKEERDFAGMMDLAGLWRVLHPKYKTYSYFSLHHKAKCLLSLNLEGAHNAYTDALLSVQLYNLYRQLQYYPALMARAHQRLLETPVDDSFAKQNPVYEEVCMGQKKTCKCGAPFFY